MVIRSNHTVHTVLGLGADYILPAPGRIRTGTINHLLCALVSSAAQQAFGKELVTLERTSFDAAGTTQWTPTVRCLLAATT